MTPTILDLARRRAKYLTDLLWHVGAFVVLNAFFWTLDLLLGASGLQWAFWITLFWGLALAFHVVAFLIDGLGLEERKTRQYLAGQSGKADEIDLADESDKVNQAGQADKADKPGKVGPSDG